MMQMEFPGIKERFFKYVKIDTRSSEESESFPTTEKQLNLLRLLRDELTEMGLEEVNLNEWGYVTATLKTNQSKKVPTIALIAHVDTSPDVSGENVNPQVHENYDGKDVVLSADGSVVLKVEDNPRLKEKVGKTLITTDGTTLLGADDKAGVAEIMSALDYLIQNPDAPRPNIRVLFTPDEEVGRGTEHITVEEIKADFGYTMDGEGVGELEDETFCADSAEVTITGVSVHPGYAKDKMINAVKVGADLLNRLPKDGMAPETTEKREGYLHPHHFSGGCEKAVIKFLVRDFEDSGLKDLEAYLQKLVDETQADHPGANLEIKVTESYRNMKLILDKYPEVVGKAMEAIEDAGFNPHRTIIRGGTDGARLSFMGLPTPNIFTGGSNFHSKYEWVTLEDMKKAAEVIVHLMKRWCE